MSMNPWQFVGFFKKKEKPKTPTRLEQMKKDKKLSPIAMQNRHFSQ